MMAHPEIIRTVAEQHRDDLLGEAEAARLLSAARRHRRSHRRHR